MHAFADDEIVMQYLPWTMRGWHAGGTDNNDHIGIELCEPAGMIYTDDFDVADYDTARFQPYFDRLWSNAVQLCAYLIRQYPTRGSFAARQAGITIPSIGGNSTTKPWMIFARQLRGKRRINK